ncbi:hypothetical protein HBH70_246760 [Parastagonospora nodorum]|uniref:Tox5 n=1 Tax=Phaeosphaeria nodorum TaxID=13684 RepID=A0A8F5VS06_PHAND|nr:hypothetical protein HBH53_256010 [Parastagonospora nodorum]KAH4198232.1 hypothetical protein HBI95_180060 [Parastagonospora nodorum]KAH4252457.1 hypothetical protein HBI03_210550 [Parastagonospora nodorum]KAH4599189.1 hypothetical protein HBH82_209880 [Parastagonospora nodorum]KAH4668531.1 hypothetical protein HBH78_192780 [Parastagonospora nodorum]
MLFSKLLFIVQVAATAIPLALGDAELTGEQIEAIRNSPLSDWTEVADYNPDVPKEQRSTPANSVANDLSKRYIIHNILEIGMLANFDCNVNKGILREVKARVDVPYENDNNNAAGTTASWTNIRNVDSFDPLPRVSVPAGASGTSITLVHNFCLRSGNQRCVYSMRAPIKLLFRPMSTRVYDPIAQQPTLYEFCSESDTCPTGRVLRPCETGMFQNT